MTTEAGAFTEAAELRRALIGSLDRAGGPPAATLADLQRMALDAPAYGVAVRALALPDPRVATALLHHMLDDPNWLVAVEAAATLALMGDRAGLRVLTGPPRSGSNSNVERFHVHAALLLLGERVPPASTRPRSVFADREALLDRLAPDGRLGHRAPPAR